MCVCVCVCVCWGEAGALSCLLPQRVCGAFYLHASESAREGCYFALRDSRSHEFNLFDSMYPAACHAWWESQIGSVWNKGALRRRLANAAFFFLLIIQSSSLFSYYCGTWCCLYWVVLIFLPCSDLMWCPRRAKVISSLIPPFFLFPHFCKGAWERALSEGASPICMYITAIYVCLFFCVMSALQKLSNISFIPQARSFHFFSFVVSPWAFWKAPFSPAARYLHF